MGSEGHNEAEFRGLKINRDSRGHKETKFRG